MTLDFKETHYSIWNMQMWHALNTNTDKYTHTRMHTQSKKHISGTAFPAETGTTQLAVPSLLCFAPCIYQSETNGLLALSHFNEPWGAAGGTFIGAVLLQFAATSLCTHEHEERDRGTQQHTWTS